MSAFVSHLVAAWIGATVGFVIGAIMRAGRD